MCVSDSVIYVVACVRFHWTKPATLYIPVSIISPRYAVYRIAGNFRGVLIFVIFVTIPRVTKFSTHEFFHPRIFSRLLTSFAYRASGVTKFKTTKINSEDPRQLFTKICTPENYPLYGIKACPYNCKVCVCSIQSIQALKILLQRTLPQRT